MRICQALDFPQPDGPTIISPWWILWIWKSCNIFSINLVSGRKLVWWQILAKCSLNWGSRIKGIEDPGKTPESKAESNGISSAISFGTTV